ncbi:MAG: hypothetical protein ACRENE_26985 [Polyangiaceae bacterium]
MGSRRHRVALTLAAFGVVADGCGGSIASHAGSDAGAQEAGFSSFLGSRSSAGSSSGGDGIAASSSGSRGSSGSSGSSGGGTASSSGAASSSGGAPDGAIICKPRTCADFPAGTCGIQSDGCAGLTAKCGLTDAGLCPAGEVCGGGGPSLCGGGFQVHDGGSDGAGSSSGAGGCASGCCPKTCADYPSGTCEFQSDGCGGLTAQCGLTEAGSLCPDGQFCGGGGANLCGTGFPEGRPDAGDASSTCFGGNCVPKTCANFPAGTCGRQDDGCCGQTVDCGADSGACSSDAGEGG